jgi:hypothetical protein
MLLKKAGEQCTPVNRSAITGTSEIDRTLGAMITVIFPAVPKPPAGSSWG